MLIPITRQKFEQLIPFIATASQYRYYWGKFPDLLKRVLISVSATIVVWLLSLVLGPGSNGLRLLLWIVTGFYWLWSPVYWASVRNSQVRRYQYSGFWRGRVQDVFVTEELIGQEETVNERGQLVIVENRERRFNLEVVDKTGFTTLLQAPLRRTHQGIAPGQIAEMLVMSNQSDLSRIAQTSDIYIPRLDRWVSDYPYLQRDVFVQVSQQLRDTKKANRDFNTKRRTR
ncbi:MAG: phosphate ABC transporter permease [Symploca sp. SIO2E6]|nr:phosphate ABC transporter permease [Symploca sp. SIO2E6]